jgi:MFS family permease
LLSRVKNVRVRPVETVHSEVSALVERVTTRVGGPARLRVVLLLAGVLSLQSADIGTIGALAAQLEKALRADNTELGLLTTAASLVGAVAGWRAPFFVLAVPSLVLAVLLHQLLPEPARGGQSWLYPGAEEIKAAETVAAEPSPTPVPL